MRRVLLALVAASLAVHSGATDVHLKGQALSTLIYEESVRASDASKSQVPYVPGRGMLLTLDLKPEQGPCLLSGQTVSDNTGLPKGGIRILLGDISKPNAFDLIAISDADGRFKVRVSCGQRGNHIYVAERGGTVIEYDLPRRPDDRERESDS
jgi:hypothetical protein